MIRQAIRLARVPKSAGDGTEEDGPLEALRPHVPREDHGAVNLVERVAPRGQPLERVGFDPFEAIPELSRRARSPNAGCRKLPRQTQSGLGVPRQRDVTDDDGAILRPHAFHHARVPDRAWTAQRILDDVYCAQLRDCQHEFHFHGFVRKHDPAIVGTIEHTDIQ